MTPRSNRQLTPNLHEIGWASFQRLCNELLSCESGISASDEYGTQGQGQRGIDVLAQARPTGLEVGQCKCVTSFSKNEIRSVSDEFFAHWNYWKDKGIRRFILFLACGGLRTQAQDAIALERKRFETLGIAYELWSADTICVKLRPHRSIALRYIDSEEIVTGLCGPVAESPAAISIIEAVNFRAGILATELEDLRGLELESLRAHCRAGEQSKALKGITEIRNSRNWISHTTTFQSRVLRFEAAVRLNRSRDTASAAILVAEAKQLDPKADYETIDAYVAYCCGNTALALSHVATPHTSEARNFRWALLLEEGAWSELDKEAANLAFPLDGEAYRVLALSSLDRGDVVAARKSIEQAIAIDPDSKSIRLAKATVDYFSALSPAAEGMKRLRWPVPVSWIYIKRDSVAVESLAKAEKEFAAWAVHPDSLQWDRMNLNAWRFACVACVETRQGEAEDKVSILLAEHPDNFGVIAWALHREYSFDRVAAEAALRRRLATEPMNVDAWLTLWSLVWANSNYNISESVLDEGETAFSQTGNRDLWLFHKVQFVARKDMAAANRLVIQIQKVDLRTSASLAITRAGTTALKAKKTFAHILAEMHKETGDSRRLFECCELKLRLGDYRFIAQHARLLVTGIGTASALRLALDGTFKHGDYALCLALLKEYRSFFRDGELSPDLRQLRAMCHHSLGDWSEAAKELGLHYASRPSLTTFLPYFDVLLKSGDTRRCSVLARDLLTLKGAKPVHWLRASSVARLHDPKLAQDLWRVANRQPIKNQGYAAISLHLAFDLGLSDEAAPLFKRLRSLAKKGRGPLREKSFDEIVGALRSERENQERNVKLYEEGSVPTHLLFEVSNNQPLVLAFHALVEGNRSRDDILNSPILFARNGARSFGGVVPTKQLLVDVSSLIIAAHLDILDKVEACFSPIHISQRATASLVEQITQLHPSQPDRQSARQAFISLVESGQIMAVDCVAETTVVDASVRKQLSDENATLLDLAVREKGVILHDGPFLAQGQNGAQVKLPAEIAQRIVSPKIVSVKDSPANQAEEQIADGSAVFLPGRIVASLTPAALNTAARRFRIVATKAAVNLVRREIESYAHNQRLASWTQDLLDRIQRGIEQGTYRVLPSIQQEGVLNHTSATWQALVDLLRPIGLTEGVTWCDDRMINRPSRIGERSVVGISEILLTLKHHGAINTDEFYDVLVRLRHGNVRYLPFANGEISHHLRRAEIKDGRLCETPALTAIRRYVNACMLDKGRIQSHFVNHQGNLEVRELAFPIGMKQAIDHAIQDTWQDVAIDIPSRKARADWLLENLYLDFAAIRQTLTVSTNSAAARDLVTDSIGMMFVAGIGFDIGADRGNSRRAFFEWLNTRLVLPLKEIEPTTIPLVAKAIASRIVSVANVPFHCPTPEEQNLRGAVFAALIQDLPIELKSEIDLPAEVRALVGMTDYEACLVFGNGVYRHRDFWRAAAEAVNKRDGHVQDIRMQHDVTIRWGGDTPGSEMALELWRGDAHEDSRISADALPVLFDSIKERIDFLEAHSDWFDCADARRKEEIVRIAQIEEPATRFEAIETWRNNSPTVSFLRIGLRFTKPSSFDATDLIIPNWERLLDHLRLNRGETAERALAASAESLLAEEGLVAALARLICLPVQLPQPLEHAWQALSTSDAVDLFTQLREERHSLVGDLHLVRLASVRDEPEMWSQAKELLELVLHPEASEKRFDCFKVLLGFVDQQFTKWREGRDLPQWTRIVCIWYHTSRLHGLMRDDDEEMTRIAAWLRSSPFPLSVEEMARDLVFRNDRARAHSVTYGCFVLHGLAYLLGTLPGVGQHLGTESKLEQLLKHDQETAQRIEIELARRSDLAGNVLNAFIGMATVSDVRAVYGDKAVELFRTESDEQLAAHIEGLAKNPDDPMKWMILVWVIGWVQAPADIRTRLIQVLKTASFEGLARHNDQMLGVALTFACHQAQISGDAELTRRMEDAVMGLAPLAASQLKEKANGIPLWQTLPNTLFALAVVQGNEDESSRRFFELFRRFTTLCPPLAEAIPTAATNCLSRLTFAQQVNAWPFLFTIRALR